MKLRNEEGLEYEAHMLRATQAYEAALKRMLTTPHKPHTKQKPSPAKRKAKKKG